MAEHEDSPNEDPPLICDRCSVLLKPGAGDHYVVRIEAVADPTPPCIEVEDTAADLKGEIQRVIRSLNQFSEQELLDQVYRRLTLYLCTACYSRWIENPTG